MAFVFVVEYSVTNTTSLCLRETTVRVWPAYLVFSVGYFVMSQNEVRIICSEWTPHRLLCFSLGWIVYISTTNLILFSWSSFLELFGGGLSSTIRRSIFLYLVTCHSEDLWFFVLFMQTVFWIMSEQLKMVFIEKYAKPIEISCGFKRQHFNTFIENYQLQSSTKDSCPSEKFVHIWMENFVGNSRRNTFLKIGLGM